MSSTGFLISWVTPPALYHNGIIRNYTVNTTEENTGRQILLTSHTNSQRVGSLHPYYNYTCTIAAVTVSPGTFSTPVTITTAETGISVSIVCIMLCPPVYPYSAQWTSSKYSNNANFFHIHYSHVGSTFASRAKWSHHQLHCNSHFSGEYHCLHYHRYHVHRH